MPCLPMHAVLQRTSQSFRPPSGRVYGISPATPDGFPPARIERGDMSSQPRIVIRVDQSLLRHDPERSIVQQWKKLACPLVLVDLSFAYVHLEAL